MAEILSNPASVTWEPEKVVLKADGRVENNTSNLQSITTLMADIQADYNDQFEILKSREDFLKAMGG